MFWFLINEGPHNFWKTNNMYAQLCIKIQICKPNFLLEINHNFVYRTYWPIYFILFKNCAISSLNLVLYYINLWLWGSMKLKWSVAWPDYPYYSQNLVISFEYSWFLTKNLSNFVSLPWKLQNRYCHNVSIHELHCLLII